MKAYTIEQLIHASHLAFPADLEKAFMPFYGKDSWYMAMRCNKSGLLRFAIDYVLYPDCIEALEAFIDSTITPTA